MVTLWILIFGFKNSGGSVTPFSGQPIMQPIATYPTEKECNSAGAGVYGGLQKGGVAVNVICLPTGLSDPIAGTTLHGRPAGHNSN